MNISRIFNTCTCIRYKNICCCCEFAMANIAIVNLLSLKPIDGYNLMLEFVGLRRVVFCLCVCVCVCSALMVLRLFPRLFTDDSAVSWMNRFTHVGFASITWYYNDICIAVAQTKYTICTIFIFFPWQLALNPMHKNASCVLYFVIKTVTNLDLIN